MCEAPPPTGGSELPLLLPAPPACTGPARWRCPWCCPLPASALSHQPRVSGLSEPQLGTQQSWTSQQLALPEHMALPLRRTTRPQTSRGGATRVMKKKPPLVLEREVQARARRVCGHDHWTLLCDMTNLPLCFQRGPGQLFSFSKTHHGKNHHPLQRWRPTNHTPSVAGRTTCLPPPGTPRHGPQRGHI